MMTQKPIAIWMFMLCLPSLKAIAQTNNNGYNRNEVGCMTLSTERSNIVYINETNAIYYHFNGFHRNQLILKGDSSVQIVSSTQIIPTTDTFELSIYHLNPDTLLFTEQFIAIHKDSLRFVENNILPEFEYCDYIFSGHNENTLYRSKPNRLFLRRNNFNDSLITFTIENGTIVSDALDNIQVIPGKQSITTIKVFHDGEIILSKEFRVGN